MSKIYIGMGGWELHPFNQYFYPPKPRKGFRKLEFYSQFFDSIEVNASFYNTALSPVHSRKWLQDVAANKEFMFTVKLYQGFTHSFDATTQDVEAVHKLLEPLAAEGKLGGLVMQFPYTFTNLAERRKYVAQLSKVFQPHRIFIELRHNSWNSPATYNFLQENKLHLVNVDLPPVNRNMPFTALSWDGAAYFRMMGRNTETWNHPWRKEEDGKHMVSDRYNYAYSERELGLLLYYIKKVSTNNTNVFVVFHNDPEANSLINGFQLRHHARHNHRVLVPQNLVRKYPDLKHISSEVNVNHRLFAEV